MPTYRLKGIDVRFPFEAYDCQLVYMESVIGALQKGQNALLESPTGTGKTLCLLCASLAWRESLAPRQNHNSRSQSDSSQDSSTPKLPTIIYASRTHSQLQQVIHELKATTYRPKMVVLGSREQLCIHEEVQKMHGRAQNQACRRLCKRRACSHYTKVTDYLKSHSEIGEEPFDIEDLVEIGKSQGPCPYYVSRELHGSAEIIFVPYNYIIDKETGKSLTGIRWENSVIIFDEAHNLEGICADASSFDLPAAALSACISEATQCVELASVQRSNNNAMDKSVDPESFAVLKALLLELEKKIGEIPIESEELGYTRPGSYIYEFLSELKITSETVTMLIDTIDYAVNMLQDESTRALAKARSTTCRLEFFRNALRTVFGGNGSSHANCYRVHVHYSYRKNEARDKKSRTFSWWCFNPGIAMEGFSKLGVRTIVLTSGTLSPLDSFALELKLPFDVRLENPHVVGPNQIWVGVVSSGPSGRPLNSSYRSRDSLEYKTELGNTIVNFARIVPDGLLVFFPSYYLLNSCIETWETPNQVKTSTVWERICKHKQPVVEPKESALFNQAHEDFLEKLKDPISAGAVFFAVCRGKVSEGLDFADQTGRAVIVTGIPFAMKTDPKVRLKKQYLDEQARSKAGSEKVLRGDEWYVQQASRAVNQAVGRVIRHKNDYGAIILCDERFAQGGAQAQLSLWLRPHLKFYTKFGDASFALTRFFKEKKTQIPLGQATPAVHQYIQQQTNEQIGAVQATSFDQPSGGVKASTCSLRLHAENVNSVRESVQEAGFWRRKTTALLSEIFEPSTEQQRPLSMVLADQRRQQLSSVAITPANRASGSSSDSFLKNISESKRLKSVEGKKGDTSSTPSSFSVNTPQMKTAAEYLQEVRARLTTQEYQRFLNCMKNLKEGATKLEDVFETMSKLFAAPERQYLLDRFGIFLANRFQTKFEEFLASSKSSLESDCLVGIPAGSRKRATHN